MNPKLQFFRDSMLDFVALAGRPAVAERLDAAITSAQNVEFSAAKFYVQALTDLLAIAEDAQVIATTTAIKTAWEAIVAGSVDGTILWVEMAAAAYTASHTGGKLLGPDQKALDLIVARAAARSTGIPSTDPQDAQHFGEGDGPDQALGNVGLLAALAMSKAPSNPAHESILPATHTVDKKLNVGSFTKTRALLYSDTITIYIDKFIAVL